MTSILSKYTKDIDLSSDDEGDVSDNGSESDDHNNSNNNKNDNNKNDNNKNDDNKNDDNKRNRKRNKNRRQNKRRKIDVEPSFIIHFARPPFLQPPHNGPDTPDHPPNDEEPEISDEEFSLDDYDEIISMNVETIDDLIKLGEMYDPNSKIRYNINLKKLNKLVQPLNNLKNTIGMDDIKKSIVNMIIYYLQGFEKNTSNMLHTVIEGPPGCGKTMVAQLIAKIYLAMGIVKKDKFIIAKRPDFIAKYLGQTAHRTTDVIKRAEGGVLFIDEAYSLGNPEGRDSFSKECLDTLNQHLTEEKTNFICIIAGYKDSLKNSFFAYNKGLERRFPFRFSIDGYTPEQLKLIFQKMVTDIEWKYEDIPVDFFEKNKEYFKYYGGDIETLLQMTKITHAKRVFCLDKDKKKVITHEDVKAGLEMFKGNNEVSNRNDTQIMSMLYI